MATIFQCLQFALMSIGALFIFILLSFFVNPFLISAASEIPSLWSSFKEAWLRPPFLYIIINCIILTIAAASRLHHHAPPPQPSFHAPPPPIKLVSYDAVSERIVEEVVKDHLVVDDQMVEVVHDGGSQGEESTVIESATWMNPPKPLITEDASPAFTRTGNPRPTPSAALQDKKVIRLSKSKSKKNEEDMNDSMENIWKTIMQGKQIPSPRQLKKSGTCKNLSRQINLLSDISPSMKKSETFKDRTNYTPPRVPSSPKMIKKEPLLSQDELNQRVEAFISKFNEDMRLERQQSLQQFMEKINRAT